MLVNDKRIHVLSDGTMGPGPVLYWMSREQRVRDNWGLLHARELAGNTRPLMVAFCLVPSFLGAIFRQYDFMLRGLEETARELGELSIPFVLRTGDPGHVVPQLVREYGISCVVTDFDPLRIKRQWQQTAASAMDVPLIEVDGHNVVPARFVSDKQEYAARTIRPKLHRVTGEFLEDYPEPEPPSVDGPQVPEPDWGAVRATITVDEQVRPVDKVPGAKAASNALDKFVHRVDRYAEQRNDPNAAATSGLSAYFHFGQLAPQRAALAVAATGQGEGQAAYLEELIVRRELTDNYCLHNAHYDALDGAPDWARKTLDEHRDDSRPYVYTQEEFEAAGTHSRLWNAAQTQLIRTGYMHGYMRMYWAKKILEWTASPEDAVAVAVFLNDRYQLDGRDPNGYVGVLWAVAGLHDRPWKTRPVFGSVRYMNENGCRRKFDVDEYCAQWEM